MGKGCRHIRHEVQPQQHVWQGTKYIRTEPGQVFCADCKIWLYERPINWDLVPKNSIQRREARIDDSRSGGITAQQGAQPGAQRLRPNR